MAAIAFLIIYSSVSQDLVQYNRPILRFRFECIYAGHIGIGMWMQEGSDVQDKIADIWCDMSTKRDKAKEYLSEDKIKSDL